MSRRRLRRSSTLPTCDRFKKRYNFVGKANRIRFEDKLFKIEIATATVCQVWVLVGDLNMITAECTRIGFEVTIAGLICLVLS